MKTRTLRIIVNGATGGIAGQAHLANALGPIMREGGLPVGDAIIMPELVLVARNEAKLAKVAAKFGGARWTTDLDTALSDPDATVLFDAGHTGNRVAIAQAALAAGKHVYTEKPVVTDLEAGRDLLVRARRADRAFGVVEDKLFLPGLAKLRHLARTGYFGAIANFRLAFGFWFFDGYDYPDQRASWNYKVAEGGGLVMDTYPHWRYVVEGILGPIRSVVARTWTAVPDRIDEAGHPYVADADDSSITLVELYSGAVGTVSATVATRTRNDDLMTFQIDGMKGSAVAGLHRCYIQPAAATPAVMFNPAIDLGIDYHDGWLQMPNVVPRANGFRMGWEAFIRHLIRGEPLTADLSAGLRDVALAKAVLASSAERRWVSMDAFAPAEANP